MVNATKRGMMHRLWPKNCDCAFKKSTFPTRKSLLFLLTLHLAPFLCNPVLAEDGLFLYLCPCYFPRTLTPRWHTVKAGAKRYMVRSRIKLVIMNTNFYSIFHRILAARCASAERQLTVFLETTNYSFGRKTILATLKKTSLPSRKNLLFLLVLHLALFFCMISSLPRTGFFCTFALLFPEDVDAALAHGKSGSKANNGTVKNCTPILQICNSTFCRGA